MDTVSSATITSGHRSTRSSFRSVEAKVEEDILVISDIDDTCFPYYKDASIPRKVMYPGMKTLLQKLARVSSLGRKRSSATEETSNRLAFITARPTVLRKLTIRSLIKRGFQSFDVMFGSFKALVTKKSMAKKKLKNISAFIGSKVSSQIVFFGDTGQADIEVGRALVASWYERRSVKPRWTASSLETAAPPHYPKALHTGRDRSVSSMGATGSVSDESPGLRVNDLEIRKENEYPAQRALDHRHVHLAPVKHEGVKHSISELDVTHHSREADSSEHRGRHLRASTAVGQEMPAPTPSPLPSSQLGEVLGSGVQAEIRRSETPAGIPKGCPLVLIHDIAGGSQERRTPPVVREKLRQDHIFVYDK